MNSPFSASPETAAPPASAWVRFLRSYGPTPTNLNLYDEHVTGALSRAKVKPISLSSPLLGQIKERVASGKPGSILIAGTAGDGKTYHCRSLWSFLGGTDKEWSNDSTVKILSLAEGRRAVFIKDLSELSDDQSDQALALMEQTVFGGVDNSLVVVAANHGQILKRLGDLGIRENRVHPLRKHIQDSFLLSGTPMERLAIFDLSRTTNRSSLEEVLRAVAGHEEWNNCSRCTRQGDGRVCPISENRTRLLGVADGGVFARRLGDLVEVARLNGSHLPVRDMLALVSNMILGHRDKETKEGLMACSDISRIQESGTLEKGSLYSNVFGANLPRRRAMDRPVFKALSSFGIGDETTNSADGLLVYGNDDAKLIPAFTRLVVNDSVYGATASFIAAQKQYLEGDDSARLDSGAIEFMERLKSQRRRLFFTLPDGDPDYGHWGMTAFRFAGDYLAMASALIAKKPMDESTREILVRGLNRVMTGLLIDNADKIFVASSGGFTQSKVSVLCDTEAPSHRSRGIGMSVKHDSVSQRPMLDVALAPGMGNSVTFGLTPVRFEFLCRVLERARAKLRDGEAGISLRGYSHVFIHSADADLGASVSEQVLVDQTDGVQAWQEVFDRPELRDLVVAYAKKDNPVAIRSKLGPETPWVSTATKPPAARVTWTAMMEQLANDSETAVGESDDVVRGSGSTTDAPPNSPVDLFGTGTVDPAAKPVPTIPSPELGSHLAALIAAKNAGTAGAVDEREAWAEETTKKLRTALNGYGMKASVLGTRLTPNGCLVRFEGSDRLRVDDIESKRMQLLTTHAINLVTVQPKPGEIVVTVASTKRQSVSMWDLWARRSINRNAAGINTSFLLGLQEINGALLYLNLGGEFGGLSAHEPHSLVAGATGSGKSVLIQAVLLDIAATNAKGLAQIVLIDPKMGVDYAALADLPQMREPIVTTRERATEVLAGLVDEMESRYMKFAAARARDLMTFNAKATPETRLPMLFLVHDEFADWMLDDGYKGAVGAAVQRLGVKARAAGIHLIFAAQRPDKDVMPMQLRENLGNRLILKVASEATSKIALDRPGAEMLLGKGHLAAKLNGEQGLVFAQAPFLSDDDINAAVEAIRLDNQ